METPQKAEPQRRPAAGGGWMWRFVEWYQPPVDFTRMRCHLCYRLIKIKDRDLTVVAAHLKKQHGITAPHRGMPKKNDEKPKEGDAKAKEDEAKAKQASG